MNSKKKGNDLSEKINNDSVVDPPPTYDDKNLERHVFATLIHF